MTGGDPRAAAAAALRRLGHAVVGHDADPALLERIADQATRTAQVVEAGQRRRREVTALKRRLWTAPPADGQPMSHFDECVVSGRHNPMGIGIRVRRDGERALARFTLGPAFEGAPGRAHGGVVAAVFDDLMGYVLVVHRVPAFTGRLEVSYQAPTPLETPLEAAAWLRHRDGRKLTMAAEITLEGEQIATGSGVFIAIPPERLGVAAPQL